jgi:NAD(P)-dependent dehydrogenase (short-subunit alcohol dehydrogenase family)
MRPIAWSRPRSWPRHRDPARQSRLHGRQPAGRRSRARPKTFPAPRDRRGRNRRGRHRNRDFCDHADNAQTKAAFDQVEREQGHLDILVNNAAKVSDVLSEPGGFWEKPLDLVDLLDVGLHSAYVCSYYAAPIVVRQKPD